MYRECLHPSNQPRMLEWQALAEEKGIDHWHTYRRRPLGEREIVARARALGFEEQARKIATRVMENEILGVRQILPYEFVEEMILRDIYYHSGESRYTLDKYFHKIVDQVFLPPNRSRYHDFNCGSISLKTCKTSSLSKMQIIHLEPCELCMYWSEKQILTHGVRALIQVEEVQRARAVKAAEGNGITAATREAPQGPARTMTLLEVADYLRLPVEKLQRAIRAGRLKAVETPEGPRFRVYDVQAFQAARTAAPAPVESILREKQVPAPGRPSPGRRGKRRKR